jgi:hypothetical protein
MNLTLTLILSWFVVSIPFGILLGKALKVLARQESEGCASLERRPPRDTESGLGWHNDPVKPARGDIRT